MFRAGTALACPLTMTMLRLSKRRRELLADKLPDAANVALGALVFGQFLGQDPPSIVISAGGNSHMAHLYGARLPVVGEPPWTMT
jgi:hypothetical protein